MIALSSTYIHLSWWQVALAAALILLCGAASVALKLGMEKSLALAAIRTTLQLFLLGLVLKWVFAVESWPVVVGMMLLMSLIAGMTAVRRSERRYRGIWLDGILSLGVSAWVVLLYGLLVVVQDVQPWYRPQYTIPLMGMLLGNALSGISLGIGRLSEELATRREQVETLLALGATRWEAARPAVQTAVRTGMTPIINAMMVVGLVSLPGMMTGQLLAGADPLDAVAYQIVIMFLIAATVALGTVGSVLLGYRRLFSPNHQFRHERIRLR